MNENNEVSVQIKTKADEANKGLNEVIANLSKVSATLDKIGSGLQKTQNNTDKVKVSANSMSSAFNKLQGVTNKMQTNFNKIFNASQFYLMWNLTKRIRDGIVQLVNSSIDYIETQNLFDTSMTNQSAKAYKFMNTMANTFGIARTELMNYQASFNNVMKSLPRFKQ